MLSSRQGGGVTLSKAAIPHTVQRQGMRLYIVTGLLRIYPPKQHIITMWSWRYRIKEMLHRVLTWAAVSLSAEAFVLDGEVPSLSQAENLARHWSTRRQNLSASGCRKTSSDIDLKASLSLGKQTQDFAGLLLGGFGYKAYRIYSKALLLS